ncbi:MAG TPA: DsbA family protein [Pseudomonadales bacterium]
MSARATNAIDVAAVERPTVCIDFKNPKAYLALSPTYALQAETGVEFDWLPLIVSAPGRPPDERPGEDRGARHRRMRARYYESDLRRYARIAGLDLGDMYRDTDTTIPCIGLLWVNEQSPSVRRAYVDAVFARYWRDQLDIGDRATIAAVLRDVGADIAGWDAYVDGPGRDALASTSARLREAGVFDVPGYIVDNEVFFGRQHLPMIGWMLSGRLGEPPI